MKTEKWPEVRADVRQEQDEPEDWYIHGRGCQLTRAQAEGYVRWIDAGIRLATGESTGLFDAIETRRILKGE